MRWIIFLLCFISQAWAAEVRLAWNPNTEPDLAGYRIHYGTESGSYDQHLDVGNVTTTTISGLADGTRYYFAATAYDNKVPSLESGYSNEVNWQSGEPPVYIGATAIIASRYQVEEKAMAIHSSISIEISANSGSPTITIPSGVSHVIIFWGVFTGNRSVSMSSLSLDSVSITPTINYSGGGDKAAGFGFAAAPSAGDRTLSYEFTTLDTAQGSFTIAFLSSADSVRDSDIAQMTSADQTQSVTVDSASTDMVIGMVLSAFSNPNGAPADSGQTVLQNNVGYSFLCDLFYEDTPGSSSTTLSAIGSYGSVIGVSISSSGGGASAVPVIMRAYRARR